MVAVDQSGLDSLASWFGTLWPWPRELWGRLIYLADSVGAEGALFDVFFDDPGINRLNSDGEAADQVLARQLATEFPSIIAALITPTAAKPRTFIDHIRWKGPPVPTSKKDSYDGIRPPHRRFWAARVAVANHMVDDDAVIRSSPLVYQIEQDTLPILSFAMASIIKGDDLHIPRLDEYNRMWIRYYGHSGPDGAFPYVSAASLIVGHGNPEVLKGKILIIGGYAAGLLDHKATPLASVKYPYPGFEIQATILSNLLQNDGLFPVPIYMRLLMIFILGIIGLTAFTFIKRILFQTLSISILIAGYICLSVFLFHSGFLVPVALPIGACFFGVGAQLYTGWKLEGQHRAKLKKMFDRYLDSNVIDDLMERKDENFMDGKEYSATVMFIDIVGFTKLSEELEELQDSRKLVSVLNIYLSEFVEIALAHRGMLDKYIGDSVMMVFGAPVDNSDAGYHAARTVQETQEAYDNLSGKREEKGLVTLDIRIGAHTDNVVLGNIGHERRMDYTAIGLGVNIASRLESATRQLKTRNLVSESFCDTIPQSITRREIGRPVLKGLCRETKVFELMQDSEAGKEWIDKWALAWKMFRHNKRKEALNIWLEIQKERPDDGALEILVERIEKIIKETDSTEDILVLASK